MAPPDTLSFIAGSVRTLLKRVHALEESLRFPKRDFSWNVDAEQFSMNLFPTVPPGVHALPQRPPGACTDEPTQLSETVQRCELLLRNLLEDEQVSNKLDADTDSGDHSCAGTLVVSPQFPDEFKDLCNAMSSLVFKKYVFKKLDVQTSEDAAFVAVQGKKKKKKVKSDSEFEDGMTSDDYVELAEFYERQHMLHMDHGPDDEEDHDYEEDYERSETYEEWECRALYGDAMSDHDV